MDDAHRIEAQLPDEPALRPPKPAACGDSEKSAALDPEGLAPVAGSDIDRDAWLRGPVAESYDDYMVDPGRTIRAEEVLTRAIAAYRHPGGR